MMLNRYLNTRHKYIDAVASIGGLDRCSPSSIRAEVLEVLKTVEDVGINIVDLGLVYDISVSDNGRVVIVLTTLAPLCILCTVPTLMMDEIRSKVGAIKCVSDVEVRLTLEPPWTPERMSEEARSKWREILMEVARRLGVIDIVERQGTMADIRVRFRNIA